MARLNVGLISLLSGAVAIHNLSITTYMYTIYIVPDIRYIDLYIQTHVGLYTGI